MKKQDYFRMKAQIRDLRRQLKEERAASYERAAFDRRVIIDLRQRLSAATDAKGAEVDALIDRLRAAAEAMVGMTGRQGGAASA